jgi:Sulfocyanin (SoxE) domain
MRLPRCSPHPALFAMLAVTPLAAQSTGAAEPAPWLAADSAARTATITLEVTAPAGSPSALLNGYREGEVQVVVPLGWTVTWDWRSADPAGKHSLVVMAEREKLPTEGGRPAFTNAMSRSVTAGLAAGQSDRTTFEAEESGWYWLLCGVPGHAIAGEWIGLRVDPEATTAGVKVKGS